MSDNEDVSGGSWHGGKGSAELGRADRSRYGDNLAKCLAARCAVCKKLIGFSEGRCNDKNHKVKK